MLNISLLSKILAQALQKLLLSETVTVDAFASHTSTSLFEATILYTKRGNYQKLQPVGCNSY